MITPAHQISGCSHPSGIDIGHGNETSPQECGYFFGINFIVFALAAMDGAHVQGMAQDKGNIFILTQISQPVPGEHTFSADNNILPVLPDGPEKGFRIGPDVSVQDSFTLPVEDAQIHFVGVQVDSTIKIMLFSVKSHEKASFVEVLVSCFHYSRTGLPGNEGAFSIIKSFQHDRWNIRF
jgi:hypothetical protein